jgi:hypothetical protein
VGASRSILTVANSSDDALAEAASGVFNTECARGPDCTECDDAGQFEPTTLSWGWHWFDHQRLRSDKATSHPPTSNQHPTLGAARPCWG